HDRLYTGPLASQLRLDVPYIPHVTVGMARDSLVCKGLADALNERAFLLAGSIDAIDVVSYEAGRVETLARVSLG
ncbi:MAG: 2'-5' RNA ligase family protein, partial [Chloroflexota bacterium]